MLNINFFIATRIIDFDFEELKLSLFKFDVFKIYIPLFFTKRGINDKNDKIFKENLTLYVVDRSTRSGVKALEVKHSK